MREMINLPDFNSQEFKQFETFKQLIPKRLLAVLIKAAKMHRHSLGQEVCNRIVATFIDPKGFGLDSLITQVRHFKFTQAMLKKECEANEKHWLYVYELEKLKLYACFEHRLPKHFKETFSYIDPARYLKNARKAALIFNRDVEARNRAP